MKPESHSAVLEKQLLEEYQVGDFFLASPNKTLLGKGSFTTVPGEVEGLAKRVEAILENAKKHGCSEPMVVGAVPFDAKEHARLIVPETLKISAPLQFDSNDSCPPSLTTAYEMKSVPAPARYIEGVQKGLNYIQAGRLTKLVLSRSLHLTLSTTIDIHQLLRNLAQHNPLGYTFAVGLSDDVSNEAGSGGPRLTGKTLIGASPELLVSRSGLHLTANPLAGSRARSEDPVEDQRLAAELLSSAKDLHEHAVVVRAVAAALQPYCRIMTVPEKPSLIHTETVWHLSTQIKGEIANPATSSLELALALHPTPAVCGSPTELARAAIGEIEPFDRGFFTGMVGWCDATGDGEWAITIRCAEVEARSLRLFAGAGVVAGSKPEDELGETAAKFRTMLIAMGLDNEVGDK